MQDRCWSSSSVINTKLQEWSSPELQAFLYRWRIMPPCLKREEHVSLACTEEGYNGEGQGMKGGNKINYQIQGKCKTRIQIALSAWCFMGRGLWGIMVSRDQQGPQRASTEGELSTESSGIDLVWLYETQIKSILPPWQVVRKRWSKSAKRRKSYADWLSALSLSSMHITLVPSLSLCLTTSSSTVFLSGPH